MPTMRPVERPIYVQSEYIIRNRHHGGRNSHRIPRYQKEIWVYQSFSRHNHSASSPSCRMVVGKQPVLEDEDTAVPLLTLEGLPVGSDRDKEALNDHRNDSFSARNDEEPGPSRKFQKRTPLPLGQIVVLCAVRLAEPISYTQIFPVSQIIWSLQAPRGVVC